MPVQKKSRNLLNAPRNFAFISNIFLFLTQLSYFFPVAFSIQFCILSLFPSNSRFDSFVKDSTSKFIDLLPNRGILIQHNLFQISHRHFIQFEAVREYGIFRHVQQIELSTKSCITSFSKSFSFLNSFIFLLNRFWSISGKAQQQ